MSQFWGSGWRRRSNVTSAALRVEVVASRMLARADNLFIDASLTAVGGRVDRTSWQLQWPAADRVGPSAAATQIRPVAVPFRADTARKAPICVLGVHLPFSLAALICAGVQYPKGDLP